MTPILEIHSVGYSSAVWRKPQGLFSRIKGQDKLWNISEDGNVTTFTFGISFMIEIQKNQKSLSSSTFYALKMTVEGIERFVGWFPHLNTSKSFNEEPVA